MAILALIGLVLLMGFFGSRTALAANDRLRVQVLTDRAALECVGGEIHDHSADIGGASFTFPVVDIQKEMVCRFRFLVFNGADNQVHLEQVSFGALGPAFGVAVEAVSLNDAQPRPNEKDAVFAVDIPLRAHAMTEFVMSLRYRPSACLVEGGTTWFVEQPVLTLRSRGVSGRRSLVGVPFGVRGTAVSRSACPSSQ